MECKGASYFKLQKTTVQCELGIYGPVNLAEAMHNTDRYLWQPVHTIYRPFTSSPLKTCSSRTPQVWNDSRRPYRKQQQHSDQRHTSTVSSVEYVEIAAMETDEPEVVAALSAVGLSNTTLIASLHDLSACRNSLASLDSCLRKGTEKEKRKTVNTKNANTHLKGHYTFLVMNMKIYLHNFSDQS